MPKSGSMAGEGIAPVRSKNAGPGSQRVRSFETNDPDELTVELRRNFDLACVKVRGRNARLNFSLKAFPLGRLGLFHGRYESEVEIYFPDFPAFAGSAGPVSGAGAHEVRGADVMVSRDVGVMLSPGQVKLHYGAGFEHVSLMVRPQDLIQKLSSILGETCLGPLHIHPTIDGHSPDSMRLKRLVQFVQSELEHSSPLSPIMEAEFEQSMMVALLLATQNNYSGVLHGEVSYAAPWQVRRAEQYIQEHWDEAITIETLVAATNVSGRSLHASFKSSRGYTPMQFVKQVRLRHARLRLESCEPSTSVAGVAFDSGFGNLGHFAKDYKNQFGESPSETLKRHRRGLPVTD